MAKDLKDSTLEELEGLVKRLALRLVQAAIRHERAALGIKRVSRSRRERMEEAAEGLIYSFPLREIEKLAVIFGEGDE